MDWFEIIEKIKSKDLSYENCLELMLNKSCWKFPKKSNGILAIYILKRIIQFLPQIEDTSEKIDDEINVKVKVDFEKLLNVLDIKVSTILQELCLSTLPLNEGNDSDDEFFRLFSRSSTYLNLYNHVNKLFKKMNLNEYVYISREKLKKIKKEISERMYTKIKLSYYLVNNKKINNVELSKQFKNFLPRVKEEYKKESDIEKKIKLNDHITEIVYFAQVFKLFYCSIFSKVVIKNKTVQQILPIHFEKQMECTKLYNLFEKCKISDKNLKLNLQGFLVKNLMENIYIYVKRFKERSNFLNEIIYKIDPKYPHLLWEPIEKKKPDLFESIKVIQDNPFTVFLEKKKNRISEFFLNSSSHSNINKSDDLVLLFFIKVWFEEVVGIKYWSEFYLHMDIFDTGLLKFKEINGQFYPIIINLFCTCWGVLYEGTIYFGNLVHVLFKYREILEKDFDLQLLKCITAIKKVSIKNFLIFNIF